MVEKHDYYEKVLSEFPDERYLYIRTYYNRNTVYCRVQHFVTSGSSVTLSSFYSISSRGAVRRSAR